MIGKQLWTSESHENYVDYHNNYIQADPHILSKIQNYIEERVPNSPPTPIQKKEKSQQKFIQNSCLKKEDKKENKYSSNNYTSPKNQRPISSKTIAQDQTIQYTPKMVKKSSAAQQAKF